jgi:hypothetical protein
MFYIRYYVEPTLRWIFHPLLQPYDRPEKALHLLQLTLTLFIRTE